MGRVGRRSIEWVAGKTFVGCISETVRYSKLILGGNIG